MEVHTLSSFVLELLNSVCLSLEEKHEWRCTANVINTCKGQVLFVAPTPPTNPTPQLKNLGDPHATPPLPLSLPPPSLLIKVTGGVFFPRKPIPPFPPFSPFLSFSFSPSLSQFKTCLTPQPLNSRRRQEEPLRSIPAEARSSSGPPAPKQKEETRGTTVVNTCRGQVFFVAPTPPTNTPPQLRPPSP